MAFSSTLNVSISSPTLVALKTKPYKNKLLVTRVFCPSIILHMDKNVLCLLKITSYVIIVCNCEFP